jgi:hypothetical protein
LRALFGFEPPEPVLAFRCIDLTVSTVNLTPPGDAVKVNFQQLRHTTFGVRRANSRFGART